MTNAFWTAVREQLSELRTAASADDVVRILAHERNPYNQLPGATEPTATGDAFFAGSGGEDTVDDALCRAGWRYLWGNAIHWAMRAPDGSVITYCEGDIYRGDKRPTNGS